jgi:helicase
MPGVSSADSVVGYCRRQGWPSSLARGLLGRGLRRWTALQIAAWAAGLDTSRADALVAGPTSAGKSLVAEIAALHHLFRGEQVLWLAPTRALAEATADQLTHLLHPLGMRVALATGDHPDADRAIDAGEYELLVAVYEKALGRFARGPGALSSIKLVVADELGMLRDPQRGGRLDLLLTLLARAPHAPRRIGLCAPGAEARALAGWWGGSLVESHTRPRPLHEGILDAAAGIFHWRDRQSAEDSTVVGREPLASPAEWRRRLASTRDAFDDTPAIASAAADAALVATLAASAALAARGEPTLLFAPSRSAARAWAVALARLAVVTPSPASSPPVRAARDLLRREPCADHTLLAGLIPAGVAVHHGDLSPCARRLVERSFASGAVRLLVATATLAHGLNLTALNVVQWPRVFRDDARGRLCETPLERWRWREQGGRAARLGHGGSPGRTLLVAADEQQRARFWRRYIAGGPGPLRGGLLADPSGESVRLASVVGLAAAAAADRARVRRLLDASFSMHVCGSDASLSLDAELDRALDLARRTGQFESDDSIAFGNASDFTGRTLTLSPFGRLCASRGLEPAVVARLLPWLAADSDPALAAGDDPVAALPAIWALAFAAPPGYWPAARAARAAAILRSAREWFDRRDESPPAPLRPYLDSAAPASVAVTDAFEAGWRLATWIGPASTPEVESETGWSAGMLQRAGEGLVWMAHALADAGVARGWPPERAAAWRRLGIRLATGAPPTALALAALGLRELGRETLRRLAAEGIDTPQAVMQLPIPALAQLTQNRRLAEQLISEVKKRNAECRMQQPDRQGGLGNAECGMRNAEVKTNAAIIPPDVRSSKSKIDCSESPASPHSAFRVPHLRNSGFLAIDLQSPGVVRIDRDELRLPPLGWDLLARLAETPGRVVTRDALCLRLWPDADDAPQPQQLDAHRRRLLALLAPTLDGLPDPLIQVVRGIGFRLNLPAERVRLQRG